MNSSNKTYNNRYFKVKEIGKGAYGKINLCFDKNKDKNDQDYFVAIKKLKIKNELGIDLISMREIKTNKIIKSENVVSFLNIFYERNKLYIVMKYFPCDLYRLITTKNIKWKKEYDIYLLYQLTKGLKDIHEKYYIHRDIKPENVLVNQNLEIKISDFGLTREMLVNYEEMTNGVCTRWYRPPEILLGSSIYSFKIDIWSLGCVFAEILLRKPLFNGESVIDQLSKIFGILGTPNDKNWPNYKNYPYYYEFEKRDKIPFKSIIPNINDEEVNLLEMMLQLDPNKRSSCEDILKSSYFNNVNNINVDSILPIEKMDLRYILN